MTIEKGDATKYVHTGNGELCYELNKALTVPETFPIYLSSAYIFDSIDPIDKICDEGAPGYAYFRLGNPNADATSQILAAGDGAEKGLVFSSGMAAITTSILATVKPGDHIVASPIIYGEAFYYLKYELKRWGVETTFIDFNTQDVADYIRPNTKLVYGETIANPPDERTGHPASGGRGSRQRRQAVYRQHLCHFDHCQAHQVRRRSGDLQRHQVSGRSR